MTALVKTTSMLCPGSVGHGNPSVSVSFGHTSYEKTFSENIVSEEEEIETKQTDGPNQYSRFFSKLVEAYITRLHLNPLLVHGYLGDEAIKVLGDTIRMSLDGIIELISPTSGYTLIYGCGRLNIAHLAKLVGLRDVIRIAQLEIRCSELIAKQVRVDRVDRVDRIRTVGQTLVAHTDHGDQRDHADHALIRATKPYGLDPNDPNEIID